MTLPGLDYIPALIAAHHAGFASDHVHLGYWPDGATYDWPAAQDAMTQVHLHAIDPRDGMTLIDIGCGIGGSLRLADGRLRDARLIGVNIDPRQLAVCETLTSRRNNQLEWRKADAAAIPLPDGTADRVLSLEAMFHFPDRRSFLAEAARLLQTAGKLVCSDIQFAPPQIAHTQTLLDVVTTRYAPWPAPVISQKAVIAMADAVGLTLVSSDDLTRSIGPTWDHIVSPDAPGTTSPVAAMRDLCRAGRMTYPMFTFQKR